MRSAIYEGELVHHRHEPDHRFVNRVAVPLLDLAEIDEVVAQHPLWSRDRVNAVSFRRRDYLGDPELSLDEAVRTLVADNVGTRPTGPISLLAHVRTWGWLFNPIAFYYCYDPTGTRVEHAIAHVMNTPWKERHAYVLGAAGSHVVDKAMHVSPFFGMDRRYRITYADPSDELRLSVALHDDQRQLFSAAQRLHRREISRAALGRVIWRYPMLTLRVSAGIHAQALRLLRKGATVHRHPGDDHHRIDENRTDIEEVVDARSTNRPDRALEDA